MGDNRLEDLEFAPTALDESPARPSWVRYQVLAAACSLAVITYIHRVGFATASAEFKAPLRSERPASRLHDGRIHDRLRPFRDPLGVSRRPIRRPQHAGGHYPGRLDAHCVPGPRRFPAVQRGRGRGLPRAPEVPFRCVSGGNLSIDLADDGRLDADNRAGLGPGNHLDVESTGRGTRTADPGLALYGHG